MRIPFAYTVPVGTTQNSKFIQNGAPVTEVISSDDVIGVHGIGAFEDKFNVFKFTRCNFKNVNNLTESTLK